MHNLPVLKIQRFSTKDGPGIRTTVFLKGCPLKCLWCHNPESQTLSKQFFFEQAECINCGKCVSACMEKAHYFIDNTHKVDRIKCLSCMNCVSVCPTHALESVCFTANTATILESIVKDVAFYGKTGGLTISGGEPFIHAYGVLKLLNDAKKLKIHTAVETCGYFDKKHVPEFAKAVDLFLWDIKDTDNTRHELYTGVSNHKILENLFSVDDNGGKTILRCIMVNGVNTTKEHLDNISQIFHTLKHCVKVEIFSYNHYSETKYLSLGYDYLGKKEWIVPTKRLNEMRLYLKNKGVKVALT